MSVFALTILMPVYNAETYLKESIDSILQQTFNNFEFLIIDDGSTDSSVSIIKGYDDPRIRLVVNEKNLGISETLNRGVALSSTELIARMDADDISYSDRIEKQYEYLQLHPEVAVLSTSVRIIKSDKTPVEIHAFNKYYNCYNVNFICPVYHPTVMFKRSIILANGGYTLPYSEDFDLWWRLSRTFLIDHLGEVLLDYRQSEFSLSHVVKRKEYDDSHHQLLLRNIHFYTGSAFQLSFNEIECLRHEFGPLLKTQSVQAITTCLNKLDFINRKIMSTDNNNYTAKDIEPYASYKKDFILYFFYVNLPKFKAVWLLYKTRSLHFFIKRFMRLFHKK